MANPVFARVKDARAEAYREARASNAWVRSRGTFIATADKNGQCDPYPEAEAIEWSGTWAEVRGLIDRVVREFPSVTKIYIAGGYDGADTKADLYDNDSYEPWVSAWDVDVWTADKGVV